MNTTADNITTSAEFLGTTRRLDLAHTTTYCRGNRDFTYTHNDSAQVITADRFGGPAVMISLTASGSMFGDPAEDDAMGYAHTVTHMTADEARALAAMLLNAADELDA